MAMSQAISPTILTFLQLFAWTGVVHPFLLDGPMVDCPNPATNCLVGTFNRVLEDLGCLGCQEGCLPGYIMVANPKYFVTEGDITGTYDYQGIPIPMSKNVSEPQWLCVLGDKCPWGYFISQMGSSDSCAYCGDGCRSCLSYEQCDFCLLGYRTTTSTLGDGTLISYCTSSGVKCPNPPANCQHDAFVSQTVGCSGCIICDDGYLPTENLNYRRDPQAATGSYMYEGLSISGSIEINEPRYTCVFGDTCAPGWHNVTRADVTTCEAD